MKPQDALLTPNQKEDGAQDTVYAVACSPAFASDKTCFTARVSGIYCSTDSGLSWHPLYGVQLSETALLTTAVAVSPSYPSDQGLFAGVPGGVLRSWNGGKTWETAALPPPPPVVVTLAVSPNFAHDGVLFAGTAEDGVFHSADRGSRWVAWNFGLLDLGVMCLAISPAFAEDETLWVGTESGIYSSTNGGRAWRPLSFAVDWAPVPSLAVSPDFATDGLMYAGTESCGLWRSTDQGETWERLAEQAIGEDVNALLASRCRSGHNDLLALSAGGLLLSRDGGDTWQDLANGLDTEEGATCVAAPLGLGPGSPLLVGLTDGTVQCLVLPPFARE